MDYLLFTILTICVMALAVSLSIRMGYAILEEREPRGRRMAVIVLIVTIAANLISFSCTEFSGPLKFQVPPEHGIWGYLIYWVFLWWVVSTLHGGVLGTIVMILAIVIEMSLHPEKNLSREDVPGLESGVLISFSVTGIFDGIKALLAAFGIADISFFLGFTWD